MKKYKPATGTLNINAALPHIAQPDPWGRKICILAWDNGKCYFKNAWGYRSPKYPNAAATFRAAASCGYRKYVDGWNNERKVCAIPKRYVAASANPVCGGTQEKVKWPAYKLTMPRNCQIAARLKDKFPGLRISIESGEYAGVTGPDWDVTLRILAEYAAGLGMAPLGVTARSMGKTS